MIEIFPIAGLPEVKQGDDLAQLIVDAASPPLENDDVVVITQKVISKAEGRVVSAADKDAAVRAESRRILRRTPTGMVIAETQHGLVCANAGIDESNVPGDTIALLPVDPDASARGVRSRVLHLAKVDVLVIISDTFGRAWRVGQTDVAIGVAGMLPFIDHIGKLDAQGREMTATNICSADELAGAAELVMGKADGICAAVVRGAPVVKGRGAATDIVRPVEDDLFR